MNLKVKLFQPFSEIVGRGEITVALERGNLGVLLNRLCSDHPKMRDQVFDKAGNVRDHLNIFINQVPVTADKETTAALRDGDEIMIMVAVAGG